GDGTVAITLSPRHDLRLHLADGTGETLDAILGVDMPGLRIIASGDADRQSYALTTPQIAVTLREATLHDAPIDARMALTLGDLSGRIGVAGGPEGRFTSHLSADSVAFDAQGQMPGEPDSAMTLTGTYG